MLDRIAINTIGVVAISATFLLPVYALWFWYWWWRTGRKSGFSWRSILGLLAAAAATAAIGWQHVFPMLLHHHYLAVGREDDEWWRLALLSLRVGFWLSVSGLLVAPVGKGQTRIFSATASALMLLTYFGLSATI
jgi:hypothetical protein